MEICHISDSRTLVEIIQSRINDWIIIVILFRKIKKKGKRKEVEGMSGDSTTNMSNVRRSTPEQTNRVSWHRPLPVPLPTSRPPFSLYSPNCHSLSPPSGSILSIPLVLPSPWFFLSDHVLVNDKGFCPDGCWTRKLLVIDWPFHALNLHVVSVGSFRVSKFIYLDFLWTIIRIEIR